MKIDAIIDAAKEAANCTSDSALSKYLGLSRSAVSNWRNEVSHPDTVACERLAGLTGIPLAKVLGIVGEARAISREEKAVWRKLAASTIAIVLTFSGIHAEAKNKAFSAFCDGNVTLGEKHYAKLKIYGSQGFPRFNASALAVRSRSSFSLSLASMPASVGW